MNTLTQEVENNPALSQQIIKVVRQYLSHHSAKDGELNLYELVLEEIEGPLFRTVMEMTRYNQSKAARVLGVSRGTLRTKLKRYFDDEFIGTRED
jgi:Fis family transcriptional regulator